MSGITLIKRSQYKPECNKKHGEFKFSGNDSTEERCLSLNVSFSVKSAEVQLRKKTKKSTE